MASPPLNPNPSSKRLNPDAAPFVKTVSHQKIELVLPLNHFHLHTFSQAVAQPLPLGPHGVIRSPDSVPTPALEYPASATMVYYNSNKQPLSASSMPFYFAHVDRSLSYDTNAQPVVGNLSSYCPIIEQQKGFAAAIMKKGVKGMRDFAFFGCRGKRAENRCSRRHLAPRLSSKKIERRDSCAERLWVPKKFSVENKNGDDGIGRKLDEEGDGDHDGFGVRSSLSDYQIGLDGMTSLMIRNIPNQFE